MVLQVLLSTHLDYVFLWLLQKFVDLLDRIFGCIRGLYFFYRFQVRERLITDKHGNTWTVPLRRSQLGSWLFIRLSMKRCSLLFLINLLFQYGFWRDLTVYLEWCLVIGLFDFELLNFAVAFLAHIPFIVLFRLSLVTDSGIICNRSRLIIDPFDWILSWPIWIWSLPGILLLFWGSLRGDSREVLVPTISFCVGLNWDKF